MSTRCLTTGEDDTDHYRVKIQAARILLEHPEDTFVTPVFNGSASLRNAAGQLIEDVTKSVRRKQTVDEAYMETLFDDVAALYHLEDSGSLAKGKADLGPLPLEAKVLLGALAGVWALILLYLAASKLRKRN